MQPVLIASITNAPIQATNTSCLEESLLTGLPVSTLIFLCTLCNAVARVLILKIKCVTILLKPQHFLGSED